MSKNFPNGTKVKIIGKDPKYYGPTGPVDYKIGDTGTVYHSDIKSEFITILLDNRDGIHLGDIMIHINYLEKIENNEGNPKLKVVDNLGKSIYVNYKQKYLKYKQKYLQLKNLIK